MNALFFLGGPLTALPLALFAFGARQVACSTISLLIHRARRCSCCWASSSTASRSPPRARARLCLHSVGARRVCVGRLAPGALSHQAERFARGGARGQRGSTPAAALGRATWRRSRDERPPSRGRSCPGHVNRKSGKGLIDSLLASVVRALHDKDLAHRISITNQAVIVWTSETESLLPSLCKRSRLPRDLAKRGRSTALTGEI